MLAFGAVAACSNSTLTDAINLSKAGQVAANAAEQAAVVSSQVYSDYQDEITFTHGFSGTALDPKVTAAEAENEAELTKRATVFASLASAYASLGNLAGYDASDQFQGDINNLFTSIGTWQKDVQKQALTPLVSPTAGALGGLIQSEMVKRASDELKTQLTNVIKIMADSQVKAQFVDTKKSIINELTLNATSLANQHLLSTAPLFNSMGDSLGMVVSVDFDSKLATNPLANQGVAALIASKQKKLVDDVSSSYDDSLTALNDLLPLHDKLKSNQPLDLTQIDQAVQKLQTIAASIKPRSQGASK